MVRKPVGKNVMEKEEEGDEDLTPEEKKEMASEKSCKTAKSEDISEDDLMKSLDKLESFTSKDDPNARKNALLEKAQNEDLDKEESTELVDLLGGAVKPTVADESIAKGMEDNEVIQKSLDVSDFLSEQNVELVKALNAVSDRLTKSDNVQNGFNLLLAKVTTNVGKMVKSISDRIVAIEATPVSKPRSNVKPLNKSFGNEGAQQTQLSKAMILETLVGMTEETLKKSGSSVFNGLDLALAVSKYEMENKLDPRLHAAVSQKLGIAVN